MLNCKHLLPLTRDVRHEASPASSSSAIFSHNVLAMLKLTTPTAFKMVQSRLCDVNFETSTDVVTLFFTSSCIWFQTIHFDTSLIQQCNDSFQYCTSSPLISPCLENNGRLQDCSCSIGSYHCLQCYAHIL